MKCQKRLEAARHLYEDGELDRDTYLNRKMAIEDELLHWQNYTAETTQMQIQLTMCVDAFTRLVELWESSSDEGRQTLAKSLFDEIVFDLDSEQIVNFKLKPWAERFLVVRGLQTGAEGTALPPAGIDPSFEPAVVWALLEEIYLNQLTRSEGIRRRDEVIVQMHRRSATKSEIARVFGISPRRVGQVIVDFEGGCSTNW